jgi:diguanylate cyclase (GGDEF)-like protein
MERGQVPPRALALSLAALAVPVLAVAVFPDQTASGGGMLIWLTALIPAFLLSYYRGLQGVALALAGGMAVITATQLSLVLFDIADPNWRLLAGIVGAYLAVAVGIGALSELLRRERAVAESLALHDKLTGLPNRRYLEQTLSHEFAAAQRGHQLAVVLFDLDHFKRVNDQWGHASGDLVLREFAHVLREHTRRENVTGRYGGEEFLAVLRDADATGAQVFAERVMDRLRDRALPTGRQTASAGIAIFQPGMGSFEVLVGEADRALYRAKRAGRDTVAIAEQRTGDGTLRDGAAADAPLPRRARIWVVDDDGAVRSMVKRILAADGHELWDTGNPIECIRRFEVAEQADRPDLVLSDVIMPEMTGMRMVDQLAAIVPDLRVLYMSAYVQGLFDWQGPPGARIDFLAKPMEAAALRDAVQRILRPVG